MNVLEVTDLVKTYVAPDGSAQPVLDIARFDVGEGEQVALRGGSGSGKTTLLHVIAGILRPDAGRVVVADVEMTALSEAGRDRLRARAIGYVFQSFHLLQGFTALENVALGMRFGVGVDAARAAALLERVGLGDRLHHLPRQLSVGQQQRVAVARALANRPRLVLADEPTGNLDAARAADALELLRTTCGELGAALLLVSHDRDALARFPAVRDLALLNRASAGVRA